MDWNKPQPVKVTNVDMAFGGRISDLLPPKEFLTDFWCKNNKWVEIFNKWFFIGLKNPKFIPVDGINGEDAYGHIAAIIVSWEPKHEHKEAGIAYLMSKWFKDITSD